jgi:hypothetical protein
MQASGGRVGFVFTDDLTKVRETSEERGDVNLARNISRGEQVEADLDAMIRWRDEKRRQTEGERLEEELYEPSTRAYRER